MTLSYFVFNAIFEINSIASSWLNGKRLIIPPQKGKRGPRQRSPEDLEETGQAQAAWMVGNHGINISKSH